MRFDTPATANPIDQLKVIGKPTDRIDGPLKTTGTAPYAYERHDVVPNAGLWLRGRRHAIAKGRIASIDQRRRQGRTRRAGHRHRRERRQARQGRFQHRQAAGRSRNSSIITRRSSLVVAETFEQARAAAQLVRVNYERAKGAFDLAGGERLCDQTRTGLRRSGRYRRRRFRRARSRRRRSSSTKPTRRPTSRTR